MYTLLYISVQLSILSFYIYLRSEMIILFSSQTEDVNWKCYRVAGVTAGYYML